MPQDPKKKKARSSLPLAPSPTAYLGRALGKMASKAYKAVKKTAGPSGKMASKAYKAVKKTAGPSQRLRRRRVIHIKN